jgi:hypothetical protein
MPLGTCSASQPQASLLTSFPATNLNGNTILEQNVLQ